MKTRMLPIILGAVVLLAACKGKYKSSSADSASTADLKKELVKTADISFKVKDARQTGETIALLTDKFGGIVVHHQMQSSVKESEKVHLANDSIMLVSAFNSTGDMTVKVPSERLEDFVNQVGHMGLYVSSSKMDIEDRTLDYLSAKLKANNRKELVKDQKSGKVTLKHPDEILAVKDDIVDKQIGNLKTDEQAAYSTITLNFYQNDTILKEIMANSDPSAYNIPVIQQVRLALANGWIIFMDIVVAVMNLWVFVLAAVMIWFVYKFYRKRLRNQHPVSIKS